MQSHAYKQTSKQATNQPNKQIQTVTHIHIHTRIQARCFASTVCDVAEKTVGNKKIKNKKKRKTHTLCHYTAFSRKTKQQILYRRAFCCVLCLLHGCMLWLPMQSRRTESKRAWVYWHFSMFLSCAIKCIPKVKNSSERHT